MMTSKELLMYWIRERYEILEKRKNGIAKPWSDDPVFQQTYFCNVRREDDKVTRFIRDFYSPMVHHEMFEYNIVLARFLNWPATLSSVGFQESHDPDKLNKQLRDLAKLGKVWGGAYLITTHGMPMQKVDYLTNDVLEAVYRASRVVIPGYPIAGWRGVAAGTRRIESVYEEIRKISGIGSFLAGQILADLKNTKGHSLREADDWRGFVVPGPGSQRGVNWFWSNNPNAHNKFEFVFPLVRVYANEHWPSNVPTICNQDLQNCLCEFDKYMRVKTGTGRSKRRYPGVL